MMRDTEHVRRLQSQRRDTIAKVQNKLVDLERNWQTKHPAKVAQELRKLANVVDELDAVEAALTISDNNESWG